MKVFKNQGIAWSPFNHNAFLFEHKCLNEYFLNAAEVKLNNNDKMKSLQTIYKCALIVLTIGMTLYCVQKYRLDHNVSLVDFKWFPYSKLDIYPSLSICLLDPISETKVDNQYGRVKKTMYKSYLSGYVLDEYLDQKY